MILAVIPFLIAALNFYIYKSADHLSLIIYKSGGYISLGGLMLLLSSFGCDSISPEAIVRRAGAMAPLAILGVGVVLWASKDIVFKRNSRSRNKRRHASSSRRRVLSELKWKDVKIERSQGMLIIDQVRGDKRRTVRIADVGDEAARQRNNKSGEVSQLAEQRESLRHWALRPEGDEVADR